MPPTQAPIQARTPMPDSLQVLDDPAQAQAVLDPLRTRILGVLCRPGSATTVAAELGESRQKINYHLRTLEAQGLIRLVEERPRRGLTERVVEASAGSYLLSPAVLGTLAAEPERQDRLSARYLLAVAGRIIREVGQLTVAARSADKRLATLTIDTEVRFADPDAMAAFTADLASAVTELVARHHDESSPGGRRHRLVVAAHPKPGPPARSPESRGPTPGSATHPPFSDQLLSDQTEEESPAP